MKALWFHKVNMRQLNIRTPFIVSEPMLKMLAVDDDHCMLKLYELMTDRWEVDLDLTCVDNFDDAVAYLKNESPDVLILDLNLNGVDGRELVRSLQGDVRHQDVKVVVVSGRVVHDCDRAEGMPEDVVYMLKPVDFGALKLLAMDLV